MDLVASRDRARLLLTSLREGSRSRAILCGFLGAIGTFMLCTPALMPMGVGFGVIQVSCLGEDCPQIWTRAIYPTWLRWSLFLATMGVIVSLVFFVASTWSRVQTKTQALGSSLFGALCIAILLRIDGPPQISAPVGFCFCAAIAGCLAATIWVGRKG